MTLARVALPVSAKRPRSRFVPALLIVALAVPFIGLYPIFVMKALCLALFAAAFNLLFGYAGLLSLGQAAFFGTAAYLSGHAMKHWGVTPEIAVAIGTLAAAALGLVFGWISIRRQGIYFSMVTLALAQLLFFVYLQAPGFSGGEDGIQAIPRGRALGFIDLEQPLAIYYFCLALCLAGFAAIYRIVHSPFGHVLKAIRENEPRAISLGYRVQRVKLLVFVMAAALSGLAGATKTIVLQLASLNDVYWALSGDVVLMTLIGGAGTLFGPVVGAFVLVGISSYLAGIGPWVTIIEGVIFVGCVIAFRQGICGWLQARRERASG